MKERAWKMRRRMTNLWEKKKKLRMKTEWMVGDFCFLTVCTVGHRSFATKQHSDSSLTAGEWHLITFQ
jgi:hypothetical protein